MLKLFLTYIVFYVSISKATLSYFDIINEGGLPDGYPRDANELVYPIDTNLSFFQNMKRQKIRRDYGMYSYPSKMWMDKASDILRQNGVEKQGHEIMAGAGWLAYYLAKFYGFSMVATDEAPEDYEGRKHLPDFNVLKKDARNAIDDDSDAEFLVLSWPFLPEMIYNEQLGKSEKLDEALEAVETWGCRGPVVYIGEQTGGCTGSPELDRHFTRNYKEVNLEEFYIPVSVEGFASEVTEIQDYPSVYIPKDVSSRHVDGNVRGRLPRKGCKFIEKSL